MQRNRFIASALGAAAALPLAGLRLSDAFGGDAPAKLPRRPLPVPSSGTIHTAFAIGPGTNVIDLAGAWEVFQDSAVYAGSAARFELFTVAQDTQPVQASGGLTLSPTYAYGDAPQPQLVVIPAHTATEGTVQWLRDVGRRADLLMSVCTGAFVLAETGLLDGKTATTHHQSYDALASEFPKLRVVRGRRFVEHDRVATAGGLTAGIDLALRVVERYLGAAAATATARFMEYDRRRPA
jgi:transcriptional regulator GlxA family with amidase domain